MSPEIDALADKVFTAVKGYIALRTKDLVEQIAGLRDQVAKIPAGKDGAPGEKGDQGLNGKDADPELIKALVIEQVAAIPIPKDGKDGKNGEPGKDGEPGPPGEDVDPILLLGMKSDIDALRKVATTKDDVAQIIYAHLERLPKPADGKDGRDGKDFDETELAEIKGIATAAVKRADATFDELMMTDENVENLKKAIDELKALPPPKDGKDGKDGENGADGLPGRDGQNGQDGRDGKDGEPGRDAFQVEVLASIDPTRTYPRGTYASHMGGRIRSIRTTDPITDGIEKAGWVVDVDGLADILVEQGEDPRSFTISTMTTSGRIGQAKFVMPVQIYRDVYVRDVKYEPGDVVTFGGNLWHCKTATTEEPGVSKHWRLSVRKGRDGKDADHARPASGPVHIA